MSMLKRFFALLLILLFFTVPADAAKKAKPTPTPAPVEIMTDVADTPDIIQDLLDIAYREWETTQGKRLKKSNKYTKWWNNYTWEWCAGFTTWCTLEAGIPQDDEKVILATEEGSAEGIYSCKASSPTKLIHSFLHMHRTTMIPQKGFIILYGEESNYKVHVGIVYDVQKLDNGKYRLTTIEGNMSNTVKMYIADYEPVNVYQEQNHNPKASNLSAVPEEEREGETGKNARTYDLRYKSKNKRKPWYVTCFLMTWIPEDTPSGENVELGDTTDPDESVDLDENEDV